MYDVCVYCFELRSKNELTSPTFFIQKNDLNSICIKFLPNKLD